MNQRQQHPSIGTAETVIIKDSLGVNPIRIGKPLPGAIERLIGVENILGVRKILTERERHGRQRLIVGHRLIDGIERRQETRRRILFLNQPLQNLRRIRRVLARR